MVSVYAVCAIVLTTAAVVALVYLVNTLRQLQRTAKALEQFWLHADDTALLLNQSVHKAASLINDFENSWGKSLSFLWSIYGAFKKQFSKSSDGVARGKTEAKL